VAKIYDGLEYELSEADDHGCDCMYWADMHYSREAAAYENIPPRFQGDIVPRYFGAWTFSVPASVGTSTQQRPVRMILIEYIDGESMLQWILRAAGNNTRPTRDMIDYSLLPTDGERLEILGRTVEAELAVWWYGGVHHQDISPRNIMISRPPGSPVRVVLIDFDLSHVLKLSESGRRLLARRELGALPISPIERYWPGAKFTCGDGFNGWISESWCVDGDVSDELAREWLVARWKGSPRYQPLSGGFLAIAARGEVSDSHRRCLAILKAEADEVRQENDDNGTWRTE
jgi:serine/threonine protein kinase